MQGCPVVSRTQAAVQRQGGRSNSVSSKVGQLTGSVGRSAFQLRPTRPPRLRPRTGAPRLPHCARPRPPPLAPILASSSWGCLLPPAFWSSSSSLLPLPPPPAAGYGCRPDRPAARCRLRGISATSFGPGIQKAATLLAPVPVPCCCRCHLSTGMARAAPAGQPGRGACGGTAAAAAGVAR